MPKPGGLSSNQKFSLIFLSGYAVIYLLVRLVNLTLLPAHYDELVYLQRTGQLLNNGDFLVGLRNDFSWVQLWLLAAFSWLPAGPLWDARLTSALAGLLGGVGCYVLALELFRRQSVAVLAALLYLVTPFVVLYDRLALSDSLLTSQTVWVLIFSLWAIRDLRVGWGVPAGLLIALASLTKLSGLYNLIVPAVVLLLYWPGFSGRLVKVLLAIALPAVVGPLVLLAVFNPQAASVFGAHLSANSGLNTTHWWANAQTGLDWVSNLVTIPFLALALAGGVLALVRARRAALLLILPLLAIPAVFIFTANIWYPRYLMPVVPSLLLLAAFALAALFEWLKRFGWGRVAFAAILLLLAAPALLSSYWLVVQPARAAIHPEERRQYLEGWPNTIGLAQAGAFVSAQARQYNQIYLALNTKSFIVTEGLKYYFDPPPNVEIVEFDPFSGHALQDLDKWAAARPTFLILNTAKEKGLDDFWSGSPLFAQAQLRAGFERPGGKPGMAVYQWLSAPALAEAWAAHSGAADPVIVSRVVNVPDSDGTARFEPFDGAALGEADFVLVDAETVATSAPLLFGVPAEGDAWLAALPPDWALTLAAPPPAGWYLFRRLANAPPQQPVDAILDERIALDGVDLPGRVFHPGESVEPVLHWRALAAVPEDFTVFAQLIGPDGGLAAQQDAPPLRPTGQWQAGQKLASAIKIPLPAEIAPGRYRLIAGMYAPSTGQRLVTVQSSGTPWPDNAVTLLEVEVQ